ncbi:MAG TPA: LysM peptidoglycan-binding domain-containing protein, partial [Opitutus sp.]|nr:LysM peptidoglycan-binding domain-containing protein [Opitutus sp.]
NGSNPAGRNLVGKKLNPAQLAAAQQRATELRTQLSSGNGRSVEAAAPSRTAVLEHAPLPELEKAEPVVRAAPSGAETSALKAEILALTTEIKDLSTTNGDLRREQGKWVQENLRLAAALRAAETALAATTAASPDSAALAKERDALQTQLSEAMVKLAAAEQRIAQLEPFEASHHAAQTQLAALTTKNEELTKRLDTLTAENQTMRQEQAAFLEKYEQLAAGNDSSSKSALVAAAEWATERETLRAAMQVAKNELAAVEQALVQLKQERDSALEAITAARTQAETAGVELAAANAQGLRVTELTASLEYLTRENAALRDQLERLDAPRAEPAFVTPEPAFVAESPRPATQVQQNAIDSEFTRPPLAEAQEKLAALERQTAAGFVANSSPPEAGRRYQPTRPRQAIALSTLRIRDTAAAISRMAAAANADNRDVVGAGATGVQQMSVPMPPRGLVSARASRIHTVAKGETLTRISVRYYGTGDRWQEIYHANREDLRGQTTIRVGQLLLVP